MTDQPTADRHAAASAVVHGIRDGQVPQEHFTPDATWTVLGNDPMPLADFLGGLARMTQLRDGEGTMTIHGITDGGDRVAVEAEGSLPMQFGLVYRNQYHFLFEFSGDRIRSVKEYMDTASAGELFRELFAAAEAAGAARG